MDDLKSACFSETVGLSVPHLPHSRPTGPPFSPTDTPALCFCGPRPWTAGVCSSASFRSLASFRPTSPLKTFPGPPFSRAHHPLYLLQWTFQNVRLFFLVTPLPWVPLAFPYSAWRRRACLAAFREPRDLLRLLPPCAPHEGLQRPCLEARHVFWRQTGTRGQRMTLQSSENLHPAWGSGAPGRCGGGRRRAAAMRAAEAAAHRLEGPGPPLIGPAVLGSASLSPLGPGPWPEQGRLPCTLRLCDERFGVRLNAAGVRSVELGSPEPHFLRDSLKPGFVVCFPFFFFP